MPGPPPKEQRSRARDNKDRTVIDSSAHVVSAPALPPRPDGEPYLEATVSWYERWCSAPQATVFTVTDWGRLHDLALVVDEFYNKPDARSFGEIRQNETLLGATALDRLRLRMDVKADAAPKRKTARERRSDPRLKVVEGGKS